MAVDIDYDRRVNFGDFGQQTPPLSVLIKGILERYPDW